MSSTPTPVVPAGTVVVWFQPVRNLAARVADGINTFTGPCVENDDHLAADVLAAGNAAWIQATIDAGVRCVLKDPPAVLPPNCIGILMRVDEPNGKGIPPAALKAESDAYRARYPGVPIWLSLAGDKILSANFDRPAEAQLCRDYAALADVLTADFYGRNRNASRYPDTFPGDCVKKLATLTGKAVVPWLEMNDQRLAPPTTPPDVNRGPTPAEIKAQFDWCVRQGAAAIGWFATCQDGDYGWPASFWPTIDRTGAGIQPQLDMVRTLNLGYGKSTPPPPPPPPPPAPDPLAAMHATVDALSAQATQAGELAQAAHARLDRMVAAAAPSPIPSYHFQGTAQSLAWPAIGTVNWLFVPLYMDTPTKRADPASFYAIPPENIRQIARLCRDGGTLDYGGLTLVFVAGAPVIFDWENWYQGHGLTPDQAFTVFRDYVRTFRLEYPGARIGIYGLLWNPQPDVLSTSFLAGLTADEEARLVASQRSVRILLDECDFVCPSCYLYGPLKNVDQDVAVYRANIREAKKLWHKPAIAWIWAKYMSGTPIEPEAAAKIWAMTEAEADGRIIWGDDFALTRRTFGPLLVAAQAGGR